jgi:hypothetical protein
VAAKDSKRRSYSAPRGTSLCCQRSDTAFDGSWFVVVRRARRGCYGAETSGMGTSYGMDGIVTVVAFAGSLKRLGLGLLEYFVILKVEPPVPPM